MWAMPTAICSRWGYKVTLRLNDLAEQIERYVATHASPGWRDEQGGEDSVPPPASQSSAADLWGCSVQLHWTMPGRQPTATRFQVSFTPQRNVTLDGIGDRAF
jgi:hypothetical protein